jgi:hypothetical protein
MTSKADREFQEIAHCGGQITIHTETDERGHRLVSFGVRHSRPTAAAFFVIIADDLGRPIATMEIGGLADPGLGPPPQARGYTIFISSDSEGLFGHQCPRCKEYWRSRGAPARWPMTCPYCALRTDTHKFLTDAQRKYVVSCCQHFEELIHSDFIGESVIDMDAISDAVSEERKPEFYYAEQRQQKYFTCTACRGENDVLGRYGYCSICGTHNGLQELESDLVAVRALIAAESYEGALSDVVSAFDSFARQLAKQLATRVPMRAKRKAGFERALFHNLKPRAQELLVAFDIDIFENLKADDVAFITRMFLRRHVYEHNGGEVDDRYINESGDTTVRPKQRIRETSESTTRAASVVETMGRNFKAGFDEMFPSVGAPVEYEERRQKMMRQC